MTLIPVSNISFVGVSCSTVGASRWIGQRWMSSSSWSPSSIVSPRRLKMRPSVTFPTGTVIGPPVSKTSMPRARPSVVSMATARTRSSPRCCWTSHTSTDRPELMPSASSGLESRSMTIAELISGSLSGKTASVTTPWISSIRPTLRSPSVVSWPSRGAVLASISFLLGRRLGQRLRARDDFHDLLRDLRLALAVHLQGEVLDEVGRVLGRVAHRGHPRAVLGRRGLQQRPVDRDLDVGGHEALEDVLRAGLVLHERVRAVRAVLVVVPARAAAEAVLVAALEDRRLLQRQQRLARDLLAEGRDVAVVEDVDLVDLAVDVGRHHVRGDVARVGVRRPVREARVLAEHRASAEGERRHAATARREPLDVLALELVGRADARADDLRVEGAC